MTPPPRPEGSTAILELGFARVDLDREQRQGLPEVVLGPGKTTVQIISIVIGLLAHNTGPVLVSRLEPGQAEAILRSVPDGRYDPRARLAWWRPRADLGARLCVVTAGTADQLVAAEAVATAAAIGLDVVEIHDVGVAGMHRVLSVLPELRRAEVVVVVAGMDGALASVVGGLVAVPVIAVPTSNGYGVALDGIAALLTMLSSCAAGITVVNIDSGFGAAMAAHRLATTMTGRERGR
jgi:pyridinium-3,5-biscarboxylic acid mononucleotide synthase